MLRLFKQKKFVIPFLVMLVLMSGIGGALAATMYTANISNTVSITSTSYTISLWGNSAHTTPLTSIDWGSMPQGTNTNRNVYVYNEGNMTAHITVSTDLASSYGTVSAPALTVLPGSCSSLTVTLAIASDAPTSTPTFTISVNNNDA